MLRINEIRRDFPILDQEVFGRRLVYLDNAATMQMPEPVLQSIVRHYRNDNANVHRGIHALSERSTRALENARERVRTYINAQSSDEIVFTSGTTASLNMIASAMVDTFRPGSAVLTTMMEHHANFVPWQQACKRSGNVFLAIPLDKNGDLDLEAFETFLSENDVALVTVTHVSNVLGTVNPISKISELAHKHNALVVVDAAQSIRHEIVDVQAMDCDFLAFSGHKMGAPTGIGVLYGKLELLENLEPVQFGGEMVDEVRVAGSSFASPPLRFEPGTPNYVGAIGLAAAMDYLESLGLEDIHSRERQLVRYAEAVLEEIPRLHVIGSPVTRAGCVSFTVEGVHPFDLATMVDKIGIALRSGNQCAQPLLYEAYGIGNITRMSPAFYNTYDEIDVAASALKRVIDLLRSASVRSQ